MLKRLVVLAYLGGSSFPTYVPATWEKLCCLAFLFDTCCSAQEENTCNSSSFRHLIRDNPSLAFGDIVYMNHDPTGQHFDLQCPLACTC